MRISDWSSDVCSSDLLDQAHLRTVPDLRRRAIGCGDARQCPMARRARIHPLPARGRPAFLGQPDAELRFGQAAARSRAIAVVPRIQLHDSPGLRLPRTRAARSEEHTSELQSLMRISYAVFCLKKKNTIQHSTS